LYLPHGRVAKPQPELLGWHRQNHLPDLGGLHQAEGYAGAQRFPPLFGSRERGAQAL
nr:hypothetical protein [Tanacetum cinerariifolium]